MNCWIAEGLDLDLEDLQQSKSEREKGKGKKRTESFIIHTEPTGRM